MVVKFIQREERKEVSNFFYSVFSQSDGDEEGKVLKKLTRELTNQISNDLIIGLKIVSNNEMVGSIFITKLDYRENIKIYLIA